MLFLHPSGQNYASVWLTSTCHVQAADSPRGQAGFGAIITIYSFPVFPTLLPYSFWKIPPPNASLVWRAEE